MADMTKAQLIADVTAMFKDVGTPVLVSSIDDAILTNTHSYSMLVLEVGFSEQSKKPISQTKQINFKVYGEGTGGEKAYYVGDEPVNDMDKDVTIVSSNYIVIADLYNSEVLQKKCLTAVITQATAVFLEDPGTTNHANRVKLIAFALPDVMVVVMEFMSALALNATVQSQGALVADSVVQAIITGAWDSYANLLVA
jgi:hypothetical protein